MAGAKSGFDAIFGVRNARAEVFGRHVDPIDVDFPHNPYFITNALLNRKRLYLS